MYLAFMCTGPNPSFDPICDGSDTLVVLVLALLITVLLSSWWNRETAALGRWRLLTTPTVGLFVLVGAIYLVGAAGVVLLN